MKILCTGGSGFIGTHLIDRFLDKRNEFINIDIAEPKKESHNRYWYECNILDCEESKEDFHRIPTNARGSFSCPCNDGRKNSG